MIIEALTIVLFTVVAYTFGVREGLAQAGRLLAVKTTFDDLAVLETMIEAGVPFDRRKLAETRTY